MNESAILTVLLDAPEEVQEGVKYTAASSIGGRENQQDSLYIGEKDNSILAVVCDGMGGMNGGERASELAVQMLVEAFFTQDSVFIPEFYHNMALKMDEAVYSMKDGEKLLSAGTTIVSVVVKDGGLYWLSVGDSKIYLYRRGQILCPVVEHNYKMLLDRMLANGQMSQEKYDNELHKGEALISFLGLGGITHIEINQNPFKLEPGDQVVLCSDGLYKSVREEDIRDVLQLQMSLEVKVKMLIDRALKNGGRKQDNTSVILLQA